MPKDQQNGIITGYSVQIAGPDFIREISITDATVTSTEVSGFRPNTIYYFSVSAMTVAGTGPPTRNLSVTPQGGKTSVQIIIIESCPDTMSDQQQCWPDMI